MKRIDIPLFLLSLILPFLAGSIGSIATFPSIPTWYAGLNKPFFNPPNWIFGPVWTTLYVMMGVALYLVWSQKKKLKERNIAIAFFMVQLILNTLWSLLFFGLHSPIAGLITIILLWIMILATIILFYKHSRVASFLLVPYLLWVSFATILNFFIVRLN